MIFLHEITFEVKKPVSHQQKYCMGNSTKYRLWTHVYDKFYNALPIATIYPVGIKADCFSNFAYFCPPKHSPGDSLTEITRWQSVC